MQYNFLENIFRIRTDLKSRLGFLRLDKNERTSDFSQKTLDNIKSYSSLFKESFQVIIENGSKDKTREILKKNQDISKNIDAPNKEVDSKEDKKKITNDKSDNVDGEDIPF